MSDSRQTRAGRLPLGWAAVPALLALLASPPASGQDAGEAAAVRYTEAASHLLRRSVTLTGTVASRRSSVVASEVEGLVERLVAREGDRVGRGKPIVELRRNSLALRLQATQGQLEEARARRRLAETRLERVRGLFEEKIVSRQQLDDAVSEVEAWRGREAQYAADAARLEDDLARATVRAPFAGVVARELVAEGEWLEAGGGVAELVDLEDLEIELAIPERYFPGLAPGQAAAVRFEALPDLAVEGTVRSVVPRADARSRAFPVKVAIRNPAGRIGVGMLAAVELPVGAPEPAVVVPKDAVIGDGVERAVLRLAEGGTVERVPVREGASAGAWIAVEGAIRPGDRVITRGNERLQPGRPVEAAPLAYDPP